MFHPVTKQQITEVRIASSMQRLSLTSNNDAQPSSHGAVNIGNSTQRYLRLPNNCLLTLFEYCCNFLGDYHCSVLFQNSR